MTVYDVQRWRRRALVAVVLAVVLSVAVVLQLRGGAADGGVVGVEVGGVGPSSVASVSEVVTASESVASSVRPTVVPVVTPSPSDRPGETVLFGGGPARGPWQQLGTVAEITHPGAPESASYAYRTFWSDPEEENQPDWLWDQLVVEVTAQLVELGEPVDRPAFGGAEGSEPFNSFGGIQDIYPDDRVFTAQWNGFVTDELGVVQAFYWYLVSFEGEVLARGGPFVVRERDAPTIAESLSLHESAIRDWAADQGVGACTGC